MTRLEKIEARLDEIEKELAADDIEEKPEEDLDKLEEEVRSLKAEKSKILNAANKRASLEKEIAEGRKGNDITNTIIGGKGKMEERNYDVSSPEFRSGWAKT